jgi:hypothetical protein
MKNWTGFVLLAGALGGLLAGCGGGGGSTPVASIAINPSVVTVASGGMVSFTATVAGVSNSAVAFSIREGATGGTVTQAGVYTAPAAIGRYHVIATSMASPTTNAVATVTVVDSGVRVSLSPQTATVISGQSTRFTAIVTGTANTAVNYAVTSAGGGSISSTGLYTAPQTPGSYQVVATSIADPTESAVATITVPSIVITPAQVQIGPGGVQHFSAAVTGVGSSQVQFTVAEGSTGGVVNANGDYTAPSHTGTFHVIARSGVLIGLYTQATIVVTQATGITVSVVPASVTVSQGGRQSFTSQVTGSSDTNVLWRVREQAGGTIDNMGNYLAPRTPGTYHVVAASEVDTTKTGVATVTVPQTAVSLAVSPASLVILNNPLTATLGQAQSLTIVPTVVGPLNGNVTYRVLPGGVGGTVTSAGVYTAPQRSGNDTVVVTSLADASKTATLTIEVQSGSGVVIIQ